MIIACFSCTGKTHFVLNNFQKIKCIDHDMYDWMYRGSLGDKWVELYIKRVHELKKDFTVFVNAIPEILNQLNYETIVIYPNRSLKEEWLYRAIKRGGETSFPKLLSDKWDEWISYCENWNGPKYELKSGEHLNNAIGKLIY